MSYRIRVIKDFPDDNIKKGELGTVVAEYSSGEYAVFLDEDGDVPPAYFLEEDFERIEE